MVKTIKTEYNSIVFRSGLEARWALFFDRAGIRWDYETQGFDLREVGWYQPDFWLPKQAAWVEIKGTFPTDAEIAKLQALANATSVPGYFFFGGIPPPDDPLSREDRDSAAVVEPDHPDMVGSYEASELGSWDVDYLWCECPKCGYLDIQFSGYADRNRCSCRLPAKTYNANSRRLVEAYRAARSAQIRKGRLIPPR